jgi:hypothetical protein
VSVVQLLEEVLLEEVLLEEVVGMSKRGEVVSRTRTKVGFAQA